QRLDHRIVSDEPRLYVHYVQHGQAKTIAATLQAIFGGEQSTVEPTPPPSGAVAPNQTPGLLSSTPYASPMAGLSGNATPNGFVNAASNGLPLQDAGVTQTPPPLESMTGEPVPAPSASTPTPAPTSNSLPGRNIRITADEANNALFI